MDFRRDGLRFAALAANGSPSCSRSPTDENTDRSSSRRCGDEIMSCVRRLHPNGRLLAVGITNGVGFWDIDRDVSVGSLPIGMTTVAPVRALGRPRDDGPDRIGPMAGARRAPATRIRSGSGRRICCRPRKGERIARSHDGRLLACCQDYASPIVLDLDHPESPIRLGPQADVRYIAISPDGRWAATGSHNSRDGVKVWSLPDGRFVKQFPESGVYATPLFSPDGRWLATNLGNELRLWTVGDWREGPRFEGGALCILPRRPSSGHRAAGRIGATGRGRDRAAGRQPGRSAAVPLEAGDVQRGRLPADPDQRRQPRGPRLGPAGDPPRAGRDGPGLGLASLAGARRHDAGRGPAPRRDRSRRARLLLGRIRPAGGRSFERGPRDRPRRPVRACSVAAGFTSTWAVTIKPSPTIRGPLAIRPGDPRILAARGEAYLSVKQYAPGFADCEASLAARPDQAFLQNNLAWAYVTAPPPLRDPAKALTHARSAVQTVSGDRDLSQYARRRTLPPGAIPRGRDRARDEPRDREPASLAPFDLFFLAMCHFHLGDTGKAKAYLDTRPRPS